MRAAAPTARARPHTVRADAVVLATGGASYPDTGSTGDGYRMAAEVGHRVVPPRPAIVPLSTAGSIAERLQGLSLRDVGVRLIVGGRRRAQTRGDLLFTHFGISGPAVLTLSGQAVVALAAGAAVALAIDLRPGRDESELDQELLSILQGPGRKRFATVLATWFPRRLVPVCAQLTGIRADAPVHQVSAVERRRLRSWIRDFRLEIVGHRPLAEAIVTSGGIDLREVDPRTLGSRRIRGLYFCGELLDLDADTGGFNLQAAFSTGWLAGRAAAEAAGDELR